MRWFQTMMTGEIFALLTEQSVLRHSVGVGWDEEAFEAALLDPMLALGRLFEIRAASLLGDASPDVARATLSARLIGAEISAVIPTHELDKRRIVVIGSKDPSAHYSRALELRGAPVTLMDAENITLTGLCMAHAACRESAP